MLRKSIYLLIIIIALGTNIKAQDKGFGAGFVLGDPSGLSTKFWVAEDHALQLGIKWSWGGSLYHSKGMMINADYIWHFTEIHVSSGKLPIYVGVGSQVRFDENGDKSWFGARVPVGIAYQFESIPIDIFFEVVPIYEFSSSKDFIVDAGIGARYYF